MREFLKGMIKHTPLWVPLRRYVHKRRYYQELLKWEKQGHPCPPPHVVKQRAIRKYAQCHNLKILIETGTYQGDMVEAMKGTFDRVISIELARSYYEDACERFKNEKNVELFCGDSAQLLGPIVSKLDQPALFWLDGHYSGGKTAKGENDTPILVELKHILDAPDFGHVIIIDDARAFGVDPAYPALDDLKAFVLSLRENVHISVEEDSIRIVPVS
ncbi:MAG: hypothetical protein ABFD54_09875 [Armatimonadota bacterium]